MLSYLRLMSLVVRTSSLSASDCKEKTKRKKLCPKTNVTSNAKWVYVLDSIIGYGAPRKCSIIIRDEYLHKYCRVCVCACVSSHCRCNEFPMNWINVCAYKVKTMFQYPFIACSFVPWWNISIECGFVCANVRARAWNVPMHLTTLLKLTNIHTLNRSNRKSQ